MISFWTLTFIDRVFMGASKLQQYE